MATFRQLVWLTSGKQINWEDLDMPNFYDITEDNAMLVDEALDFLLENTGEEMFVDEDEVHNPEIIVVEEPKEIVPGSSCVFYEEEEDAVIDEPKTWENDGDHSRFIDYAKDKIHKYSPSI